MLRRGDVHTDQWPYPRKFLSGRASDEQTTREDGRFGNRTRFRRFTSIFTYSHLLLMRALTHEQL